MKAFSDLLTDFIGLNKVRVRCLHQQRVYINDKHFAIHRSIAIF